MTSELKCPHCGETLRQSQYIEPLTGQKLYFCDTHDCYPTECVIGTESMWQAMIHTKKQLDMAKWWLKEIVENHRYTPITTAEMALKELD